VALHAFAAARRAAMPLLLTVSPLAVRQTADLLATGPTAANPQQRPGGSNKRAVS